MNILYLHGFASRFDPDHPKVLSLREIGNVSGLFLDYTKGPDYVIECVSDVILKDKIDLVVGTSMGGWLAAVLSKTFGIPFIAMNPSIEPSKTLKKYIGDGVDYSGNSFTLDSDIVNKYYDIPKDAYGTVFVEMCDEVIDPKYTIDKLKEHYEICSFEGGSHRFERIDKVVEFIKHHYDMMANATDGRDND